MPSKKIKFQIGVLGAASPSEYPLGGGANSKMFSLAYETGRLLALQNAAVVTGGKSGVMEAASKGASENGGLTIGVVKGPKRGSSNAYVDIECISGMASDGLDELLLVNMCDAVIVIGGGAGTLEEITIAYRNKKPIISLSAGKGWGDKLAGLYIDERKNEKILFATTPLIAVKKALAGARHSTSS